MKPILDIPSTYVPESKFGVLCNVLPPGKVALTVPVHKLLVGTIKQKRSRLGWLVIPNSGYSLTLRSYNLIGVLCKVPPPGSPYKRQCNVQPPGLPTHCLRVLHIFLSKTPLSVWNSNTCRSRSFRRVPLLV